MSPVNMIKLDPIIVEHEDMVEAKNTTVASKSDDTIAADTMHKIKSSATSGKSVSVCL